MKHEVTITLHAADFHAVIDREGQNNWQWHIQEMFKGSQTTLTLTDKQSSAMLALFIGEIEDDPELNAKLYAIAEEPLKGLENSLRPIP